MIERAAIALAVLGPPLVGAIALVVSFFRFRAARVQPSISAAAVALALWLILSAGATYLGMQVAFGYAWGWAHARRPILTAEYLRALAVIGVGLLVLGACASAIHGVVRRKAHSI